MKIRFLKKMLPCVISAAFFSLSGLSSGATLLYGLDFNTYVDGLGVNFVNLGSGSLDINRVGNNSYCHFVSKANSAVPVLVDDIPGSNYAILQKEKTFSIADANGIQGLNIEKGFSIGFHAKYEANINSNWKSVFAFSLGANELRVEKTDDGLWSFFCSTDTGSSIGGILHGTKLFDTPTADWNHIGLTFLGNSLQVFLNGTLSKTINIDFGSDPITEIRGGSKTNASKGEYTYIDNLAVYDGVLSAGDFQYLSNHQIKQEFSVPESSTATLGLAAMALLSIRRKRKI